MASNSVFKTVVVGTGAGVGAYLSWVGLQVASVAREEVQLQKRATAEERQARKLEAEQKVEESAVERLLQQLHIQQQELSKLDADLEAARQRVGELEATRTMQAKAAEDTAGAVKEATARVGRLAEAMRKHREAAAVAQEALRAAHIRVEEKRALVNPFNIMKAK